MQTNQSPPSDGIGKMTKFLTPCYCPPRKKWPTTATGRSATKPRKLRHATEAFAPAAQILRGEEYIPPRPFVSALATSILLLFGLLLSGGALANDWGPALGPSFPDEIGQFEPVGEGYIGEYDESDVAYEIEVVPEPVTASRLAKPLPSRRQPARRTSSRLAAFNETLNDSLEPGKMIMPQGFLDEETAQESATERQTLQNVRKKKVPTNLPTLETDDLETVPSGPAGNFSFADDLDGAVYDESYGEMTYGNGLYDEGLYDKLSPAMAGSYFGPMMMKPFGTGVMDNLTFFAGATGFRSELDADRNGNFGFSEGVNWAGPATPQGTVSAQLGFRAVQSNLNGSGGTATRECRNQYFVTAGIYKRDLAFPLQGGVALDWMNDDFYGKVKVRQFRAELSARTFSNLEYGFLGGFGVTKKDNDFINRREDPTGMYRYGVQAQHYYLLFLRKHLAAGGLAEFRCGLTENGDTILSALAEFPLHDRIALYGSFTAMIPEQGQGSNGFRDESWDVSVGFVFYFRGGASSKPSNPCRPMFSVADNSAFFNRLVRK